MLQVSLAALDWLERQEGALMAIGVGTIVVVLHVLLAMEFLMNHMLMLAVCVLIHYAKHNKACCCCRRCQVMMMMIE